MTLAASASLALPDAAGADSATPPSVPGVTAPAAAHPRATPELVKQAETLAQRIVSEARISGLAIAIVQDDRILLERGFGVTDTATRESIDADTVFRIASLSKSFAGTVSAMLVAEGAMRWDTRVADHLPAFKLRNLQSAQSLTVLDILSHRVGLPHNTHDRLLEADEPYPLLVAKLDAVSPICEAGQCYSYQNVAFSLIGDLVFAVTGDFYSHQVEKRIFHPLGMYNATFGRDALEASARWARPHVRRGGRWVALRPKETYYRIPPAAGVNASIHDLALWMQAQLGQFPDVIAPEILAEAHAARIETPGELGGPTWRRERITSAQYGLGWRLFDYEGAPLIFHAGAVQGYRAMLGVLPEHGFGVALVWNCESGVPGGLFPTVLDRYLGLPQRDWLELHRYRQRSARTR